MPTRTKSTLILVARNWPILISLIGLCLASNDEESGEIKSKAVADNEVQASGWLQISERWPVESQRRSHFYLVDKGHHSIEAKLPKNLSNDLEVRLEYYVNYTNVRPVFQLIPCAGNAIAILADELPKPGWRNHTWSVRHNQCKQRNRLTYDIILHDKDDYFGWSALEIRSIQQPPATTTTKTPQTLTTREPTTAKTTTTRTPTTAKSEIAINKGRSLGRIDPEDDADDSLVSSDMDQVFEAKRSKREDTGELWALTCRPELCDRSLVQFPDFKTIIGGLEDLYESSLADSRYRFYLNTNNEPLRMVVEAKDQDLVGVDVCLEFYLFMDAGTSISLELNDTKLVVGRRLLEKFDSTPGHWAAGAWQTIKRCMSNYMPKIQPIEGSEAVHRLELSLIPHSVEASRDKIMVKFVDGRSRSLRELPKALSYLPDAANLNQTEEVEKMWIIDRDVLQTPEIRLDGSNNERALLIEKIEPTLEYFDLVSHWIQVDEADLSDNSTMFRYKLANKPDWVKSIEFGFQKAGLELEDTEWHTDQIYTRQLSDSPANTTATTNGGQLSRSIKLKSINSGKGFRLRLRHFVDKSFESRTNPHKLTIRTLSMGDICALEQAHCLNGGHCRPTGISRAECTCLRGYSDANCQEVRPCEVLRAGNLSGSDFCGSVGAQCAENIPVFRCVWPNDTYYHCSALGGATNASALNSPEETTTSTTTTGLDENDESRTKQLEGRVRKQSRLILVLGALLATALFVALITIVNLAAKLRKSRSRLETAQVGVHELTRQFRPNSSNFSNNSNKDIAMGARRAPFESSNSFVAYSNRGFDSAS